MTAKQYAIHIHTKPIDPPLGDGDDKISTSVRAWIYECETQQRVHAVDEVLRPDESEAEKEAYRRAKAWIEEQGGELLDI